MKKFIAKESFWELFPDAKLGVLIIKDTNNNFESPGEVKVLLQRANTEAEKFFVKATFSENPVIAVWREAYKKFKTKKGVRASIEALLKRVEKGQPVGTINPIVDIYNAASLNFGIPCGAEDIDTFDGDLNLGITQGGDSFVPLGGEESPTLEGELCYYDNSGAVCRCFNWRDAERTMITENTKNVFLIMELLDRTRDEELDNALEFLNENIKKYCGGEITKHILTKDNKEIEIE